MSRTLRVFFAVIAIVSLAGLAQAQVPSVDLTLQTYEGGPISGRDLNSWELWAQVDNNTGGIAAFNIEIVDPGGTEVTGVNLAPRVSLVIGGTELSKLFGFTQGGSNIPNASTGQALFAGQDPQGGCPACQFGIGVVAGELIDPLQGAGTLIGTPYDVPVLLAAGTGPWGSVGFGDSRNVNLFVADGNASIIGSQGGDVTVSASVMRNPEIPEPSTFLLFGIAGVALVAIRRKRA